jgi:hypothetical protein
MGMYTMNTPPDDCEECEECGRPDRSENFKKCDRCGENLCLFCLVDDVCILCQNEGTGLCGDCEERFKDDELADGVCESCLDMRGETDG